MSHQLLKDIYDHLREHIRSGDYDYKDVEQSTRIKKALKGGARPKIYTTPEQLKKQRKEANRKYYLKKRGASTPEPVSTPEPEPEEESEEGDISKDKIDLLKNMLEDFKTFNKDQLKEIVKNISEANPSLNIKYDKKSKDTLIKVIINYKISK